jgi:hypothetical protein
VAEASSMFSGGEKTIFGIVNLLKKTLTEGVSIIYDARRVTSVHYLELSILNT